MDLDSCQIIVENIGPSKGRAGDEAPEFVILMRTHQLHINPLPQVFHGLPEDRVVHELVEVPLKVAGGILSELCMAPSKGFGQTGLWSDACPETCTAADSDSEAHSGPCCGGCEPAFQPWLAPPQCKIGCADTPTSTFSDPPPPPHALRCQRICTVRIVKLFWVLQVHPEYKALWIVCWMICKGFGQLLAVFIPPPPEGARG